LSQVSTHCPFRNAESAVVVGAVSEWVDAGHTRNAIGVPWILIGVIDACGRGGDALKRIVALMIAIRWVYVIASTLPLTIARCTGGSEAVEVVCGTVCVSLAHTGGIERVVCAI
jgi:hypothetical protein